MPFGRWEDLRRPRTPGTPSTADLDEPKQFDEPRETEREQLGDHVDTTVTKLGELAHWLRFLNVSLDWDETADLVDTPRLS